MSVAAYNGVSTVLSGPGEDAELAAAAFTDAGIRCEWLQTSHAFHSTLLEPALDEFESHASNVDYSPPQLTFVCNRTGEVLTRRSRLDARYWRRHARQPVRFDDSVATLAEQGCSVSMAVGPQPVLTAAAIAAWPDAAPVPQTIASLRRGTDDGRCLTEALAAAYVSGHRLDFAARCARPARPVDLPTYPFQHRTYWFPAYTAPELNSRARAGASWSRDSEADPPRPSEVAEAPLTETRTADWLLAEPPEKRLTRITDVIVAELANALRTSTDEIERGAEFISLGMDSLMAMDLRRRLQAALGTEIPASVFFAHPNVSALAEGLLAVWLGNASDGAKRQIAIPRVSRDGDLPLSHAQEQLWFLHELLPSSSVYNVAARVDIPGPVDRHVLQRTFDAVMARHEILRTTYRSMGGVPQTVVGVPQPFELPFERVSAADVSAAAEREATVPFDIAVGPLLRADSWGSMENATCWC